MKWKSFFSGVLAIAAVVGCKELEIEPELNVNRSEIEYTAEGGSETLEVTSNVNWSATTDAQWVEGISPSQGNASAEPTSVVITVEAYEGTEDREAEITITAADMTKTVKIVQKAKEIKEEKPVEGTDSDLLVAWVTSPLMKEINRNTSLPNCFYQDKKTDFAEGFSTGVLGSAVGKGQITYWQADKSAFSGVNGIEVGRHIGNNGEPMVYGAWEGDYFLFKADATLPENSNVSISFGFSGKSSSTSKYWLLEYKDGSSWKPALETKTFESIEYNVECTTDAATITASAILANAASSVEFRLKCVSTITIGGNPATAPAQYIRIDPSVPIIIKGGTITDADRNELLKPEFSLNDAEDKAISAVAAGAEAGSAVVKVATNMEWTAVSDTDWASVLPVSGTTSADANISFEENPTEQARTATLTFTATYENITVTKTVTVAQEGKAPAPVVGTDSDLFVAWAFSADMNPLYKATFSQEAQRDAAAGDGGKYLDATLGNGKVTYVQLDKSQLAGESIYRFIHGSNYPMVYGVWEGDYFLFEATPASALPANSNVAISFYTWASNNKTLKYWMLEYLDGETWKPALETKTEDGVSHNVAILNSEANTQNVNALVVLANSTSKVSFRMRCVSNKQINGDTASAAPTSAIRIDSKYPIIIKGSAIEGKEGVIEPAVALDKTTATVEATAQDVALAVTSNMQWTAAADADWVTVSPASGSAADAASSVAVAVAENTSTEPRTATVTVTATYGNASIAKTLTVTQNGKAVVEPEPEQPKLTAKWEWNANGTDDTQTDEEKALQAAHEASFIQTANDLAAGDSDKYIAATTGTGKLTYVQVDKTGYTELAKKTVYRHVGKNGEPVIYGVYEGDYFLFEVDSETAIAAGAKFNIQLGLYGSADTSMKYWILEYKDGENWIPAIETTTADGATYNVVSASSAVAVSGTAVLTHSTDKVSVRLRCASNIMLNDKAADVPQKKWTRLDPKTHVVISQE